MLQEDKNGQPPQWGTVTTEAFPHQHTFRPYSQNFLLFNPFMGVLCTRGDKSKNRRSHSTFRENKVQTFRGKRRGGIFSPFFFFKSKFWQRGNGSRNEDGKCNKKAAFPGRNVGINAGLSRWQWAQFYFEKRNQRGKKIREHMGK